MEYLLAMTTRVPAGTPEGAVAAVRAKEATRSGELALQGHLERLWRPPGEDRALGLWRADDDEVSEVLASLAWSDVRMTPLSPHPNDPAGTARPTGPAS